MKRSGNARARPEILAPVGSAECLPAAVAGGADAVYLGLRHFNARGRAANFRKADLGRHVDYLHGHGVKCYVVMNTLVHDDEYPKALELAACARDAGVDAVIVQDLGLWHALGRELPGLMRHASTQMTVHDPSQVEALARLGAERVILARELTLAEVDACTRTAARLGIETEHFVHGALCYAFSGQCLMSNFAGCRSANRGTCAQNCRFDYRDETAGATRGEGATSSKAGGAIVPAAPAEDTMLSMRDLSLVARVGELADIGVASLKIEGRLKGPDYVYTVSRVYREAADAWEQGRKPDLAKARELLKDVFARANSDAPLAGDYADTARLHRYDPVQDRAPDAKVISADRARGELVVDCRGEIRPGQGYAFSVGFHNGGFLVTRAERGTKPGTWRLLARIAEHGPRLPAGLALFRNADHERKREAVAAMARVPVPAAGAATIAVDLIITGRPGQALAVSAVTIDGRSTTAHSLEPLREAANAPIDEAMARDKLGAFGGTAFHLAGLTLRLEGACFLPASALKQVRRTLVDALSAQAPSAAAGAAAIAAAPAAPSFAVPEVGTARRRQTALWVAVGSLAAGSAALAAGADAVWLDDATLDLWSTSPPVIDASGFAAGSLWLRHPATAPLSPHLEAIGLPVVAGHIGALSAAHAAGLTAIADVFCNAYSTETLRALSALGASAAVISLECSGRELARLAARCASMPEPRLAFVAAGRLPAMLTRQDHGLATGGIRAIRASHRDGDLPYELQRRIRDTVVWEGRRLCAPEHIRPTAGLADAWVLEFADLMPDAVAELVRAYVGLRDGAPDDAGASERVRVAQGAHAPLGLFTGHLHQGSRELDLVVEEMETSELQGE